MSIAENLRLVRERIARAATHAHRDPREVTLVAVAKTFPASVIREAYAQGQRHFGENYVQELANKATELADLTELRWHFIGHLQRNKVKLVTAAHAVIETVDSERLATEIANRQATPILLQVNVGGEEQKSGCAPEALPELIAAVRARPELELRGLMTIPPAAEPEAARPYFRRLSQLANKYELRDLSMGMSADLEVAIEEGATLVRVGTAIFGGRTSL